MDWRILVVATVFSVVAGLARLGWSMRRTEAPGQTSTELARRLAACEAELARVRGVAEARGRTASALKRDRGERTAAMIAALREPLTAVCGFAEAALLPDAEPMTPRQARAFAAVAEAGRRIRARLDGLTTLADLDTGAAPVRLERLDPLYLVRDACDTLAEEARAAGVTLHAPPAAAGFAVLADPALLAQTLRALINNAVRYNRVGGAVLIEVRREIGAVRIAVHDTGVGLDETAAARAFEPFAPNVGHGTGDGGRGGVSLAIARRAMVEMDGWIEAAGTPGEGASVTLRLPAAETAADPPRLPRGTLLYVDDDPVQVTLIRHVVAGLGGAALHVAADAAAGEAMALALNPDVVLVRDDRVGLDALAFRAALAADPRTRGVPVLALSAARSSALRRSRLAAGFAGWLELPLDIPRLAETLSRAMTPDGRSAAAA